MPMPFWIDVILAQNLNQKWLFEVVLFNPEALSGALALTRSLRAFVPLWEGQSESSKARQKKVAFKTPLEEPDPHAGIAAWQKAIDRKLTESRRAWKLRVFKTMKSKETGQEASTQKGKKGKGKGKKGKKKEEAVPQRQVSASRSPRRRRDRSISSSDL